jgi:two-component system chemotaxis response regulator CheY
MATFRCLVVEDSPTMRQLIVFALKRLPELEIIEASDGVDALAKLPGARTDLVLTGTTMPIMGGLKLVALMKDNPLYRDIPVVIITAEGAAEDREKGMALGARASLPKPIQTGSLLKVVREVLGI